MVNSLISSTHLLILVFSLIVSVATAETNTLNRGNGAEPDSLRPHLAQGLNSHNILHDIYEGLFTYDETGQAVPGAVARYEISDDGLTWDFYLKDNASWSDGEPLTASDFIFAWQKAVSPDTAAPYAFLFANMQRDGQLRISSNQASHLRIQLNQIDSALADKLLLPVFAPLPKHQPDEPVYNGAYVLSEHRPHEWIALYKNRHYHSRETVRIPVIRYIVTENQNSELLKFRAGELDITETVPDTQLDWLRKHYPKALRVAPYNGSFFLGLNLADKHLQDKNLRTALYWAIDRDILVDKVLKSGQKPAAGLIPTRNNERNAFDLDKAREYLAKSDFKVDSERLDLLYNNSNNQKKTALAVAAMWRQNLGIKTRLHNQEWKVFIKTRQGPNKQVFRGGWIADYKDPLNYLQLFESDSRFNYYQFNDADYDQLVQQIRATSDKNNRNDLIKQAESILQSELPLIPLYFYVSRHLVKPNLKGYSDNLADKHLSRYLRF